MNSLEEDSKIEKRKFRRMPYREPIHYSVGESHEGRGSVCCDISERGLRLQVNDFIPVNTRIVLEVPMSVPKHPKVVTLSGRIVWTQQFRYSEQYQVGLEFNDLDAEIKLKEDIGLFVKSLQK